MAGASEKVMRERAKACERYLRMHGEAGPVAAVTLAGVCGIHGKRETVRRRIREAIDHGRQELGIRFCANGDGYWLARDANEWAAFRQSQKAKTVFKFVRAAKCQRAVTEAFNEQGKLFETAPFGIADG